MSHKKDDKKENNDNEKFKSGSGESSGQSTPEEELKEDFPSDKNTPIEEILSIPIGTPGFSEEWDKLKEEARKISSEEE